MVLFCVVIWCKVELPDRAREIFYYFRLEKYYSFDIKTKMLGREKSMFIFMYLMVYGKN